MKPCGSQCCLAVGSLIVFPGLAGDKQRKPRLPSFECRPQGPGRQVDVQISSKTNISFGIRSFLFQKS
jgi:hypothetical protein